MRVVFDTNVLISGFLTTAGVSQYVFMAAVKRHQVIVSEYILKELEHKLTGKLGAPQELVKEAVHFLRRRALVLNIHENPTIDFPDKKDKPILSLVEASKANYFVTGDKKLLALKKFGPTLFLSPREAMEIFTD